MSCRALERWLPAVALLAIVAPARAEDAKSPNAAKDVKAEAAQTEPIADDALTLFRKQDYAAAVPKLRAQLESSPDDLEAWLLLGISQYRLGDLTAADEALRKATASPDRELAAAAHLFLSQLLDARGASDEARGELERAARAPALGAASLHLQKSRLVRRLSITLLVGPELDGNLPLTSLTAWSAAPTDSLDGDVLLLVSASLRPIRRIGLSIGSTLSYRQQFRNQAYSLLLSSSWLGYTYQGESNLLRVQGLVSYALMGGSPLYVDGGFRGTYRRKLRGIVGMSFTYEGRYRDYLREDFLPLTGHTHTGQLEVSFGLRPEPVSANLGYQVLREELEPPDPAYPKQDFRALAHGPLFRLRARPQRLIELSVLGSLLHRRYDYIDSNARRREDAYLYTDVSLSADVHRYVELFLGCTLIYNYSNDSDYSYFKPLAYAGLAAHFSVL